MFDMTTLGTGVSSLPRGSRADRRSIDRTPGAVHTTVAVVAYPRISNLDEFQPLRTCPACACNGCSPADSGGPAANGLDRAAGVESHGCRPGLAARTGPD